MATDVGTVLRRDDGSVALLTLSWPERRNALSPSVLAALHAQVDAVFGDPAVRVVVLTGADGHFSAGGDIGSMVGFDAAASRAYLESLQNVTRRILAAGKPVLAAVEGFAAGAGLSLVAACDIVVAARTARFACSFNRIGLAPDAGAAWLLPRRVGSGRARLIMLGGDPFDAETAERWGLVEILADAGEAVDRALALGQAIAETAAPLSNAASKALLVRPHASLDDLLSAEAEAQVRLFASADFAEGRAAFLAKRKPVFRGD